MNMTWKSPKSEKNHNTRE